jgi:hypothetical protein
VFVFGRSLGATPSSVASVSFGSLPAGNVVFHHSGFVECIAPAASIEGFVSVSVEPAAPGGAPPVSMAFAYAYPAPVLENAKPRLSVGSFFVFLFFVFLFFVFPAQTKNFKKKKKKKKN